MQTITPGMDKQWDPSVWHRELYLVTCNGTWQKIMWEKEYIYICVYIFIYVYIYIYVYIFIYMYMTESLCCIAETDRS